MCAMRYLAFGISLLVLALTPALPAQQHDEPPFPDAVLGRWDLTVQGVEGAYPSWLHVHLRKDNQLHAAFVGRFGSVRYATSTSSPMASSPSSSPSSTRRRRPT